MLADAKRSSHELAWRKLSVADAGIDREMAVRTVAPRLAPPSRKNTPSSDCR